jgi:Major Facilitator Superfamily
MSPSVGNESGVTRYGADPHDGLTGTNAMIATPRIGTSVIPASHVLGSKLDSIPFSAYHLLVILVLGIVGLIDGYDLAMTGSLLVLAKEPLHITPSEIRVLAVASTLMICVGGFAASTISDHWSRRTIMLIGVATTNLFTLLIPLVQTGEQLIIVRLLTGLAGGFAVAAPFPIAAEMMPAQHRRTSPCCRSSPSCLPTIRTASG